MGFYLILVPLFIGVPVFLTVLNIRSIIKRQDLLTHRWSIPALTVGMLYTLIFFSFQNYVDYNVTLRHTTEVSTPLASWHLPTMLVFVCLSLAGYVLLHYRKELPPIVAAICMSSLLLGCILGVLYTIQLWGNMGEYYYIPLLYPINAIVLYIRMIRYKAIEMANRMKDDHVEYRNPFLNTCVKLLSAGSGWILASFLLMFPLSCVIMVILVLFGQRPDAAIKVFTDTAEWTLSQQELPPDIEYTGHYLCTVAAQGHPSLVKPLRYGRRHGRCIIVNRQLCVANAFEQVIEEKLPRLHQRLRRWYDTYGYPLSRNITTKFRADVVYLLMKPLEYLFVVVLYLVDIHPGKRISSQYKAKTTTL